VNNSCLSESFLLQHLQSFNSKHSQTVFLEQRVSKAQSQLGFVIYILAMPAASIEPGGQVPQHYGKDPPLSECPEPIAIVGMGEHLVLDCINVSKGATADDKS
jgi:hypothetical protein